MTAGCQSRNARSRDRGHKADAAALDCAAELERCRAIAGSGTLGRCPACRFEAHGGDWRAAGTAFRAVAEWISARPCSSFCWYASSAFARPIHAREHRPPRARATQAREPLRLACISTSSPCRWGERTDSPSISAPIKAGAASGRLAVEMPACERIPDELFDCAASARRKDTSNSDRSGSPALAVSARTRRRRVEGTHCESRKGGGQRGERTGSCSAARAMRRNLGIGKSRDDRCQKLGLGWEIAINRAGSNAGAFGNRCDL